MIHPQRDKIGSCVMDIGHRLGSRGDSGRAVNSRGMGAGR